MSRNLLHEVHSGPVVDLPEVQSQDKQMEDPRCRVSQKTTQISNIWAKLRYPSDLVVQHAITLPLYSLRIVAAVRRHWFGWHSEA